MNKIKLIYSILFEKFGSQGWWPLSKKELHPKHHAGSPLTDKDKFEIVVGAVLTQNTNWNNVEKALFNLNKAKLMDAKKIVNFDIKKLGGIIRPSGYYNQKAERLKIISKFFLENKNPTREQLLELKGVGPETADSILLYAYEKPEFVIDAYAKRICSRLFGFEKDMNYDELKDFFEDNLDKDVNVFQEYHALLVELGKKCCKKAKPLCDECVLLKICKSSVG